MFYASNMVATKQKPIVDTMKGIKVYHYKYHEIIKEKTREEERKRELQKIRKKLTKWQWQVFNYQ